MKCFARSIILTLIVAGAGSAFAAPTQHWLNSGVNNRDMTFSPDGNILLTSVTSPKNQKAAIVVSYNLDGRWSDLQVAPFSGHHPDIEPAFSPDGHWLFFASRRPKPDRDARDWDLWKVKFGANQQWGNPQHLGDAVNSDGDEYYPSVTSAGVLYFTATRPDTLGREDLYRAKPENGAYRTVENVGTPVNSAAFEFNAFIAPDESYLIFGAQLREGETGGGDLYISYRNNKTFSEPVLLASTINTKRLDYCPSVHDGFLYFTSERLIERPMTNMQEISEHYELPGNGFGDIYRIPFEEIVE